MGGEAALDAASRVHEIASRAIVACGELDVAVKVRRSAELADALPNATYQSLPGRARTCPTWRRPTRSPR